MTAFRIDSWRGRLVPGPYPSRADAVAAKLVVYNILG
jgi:hypothetical protein